MKWRWLLRITVLHAAFVCCLVYVACSINVFNLKCSLPAWIGIRKLVTSRRSPGEFTMSTFRVISGWYIPDTKVILLLYPDDTWFLWWNTRWLCTCTVCSEMSNSIYGAGLRQNSNAQYTSLDLLIWNGGIFMTGAAIQLSKGMNPITTWH
jgi:hypothetical protein